MKEKEEVNFQPTILVYSATILGQTLKKIHRAQSMIDTVRDSMHVSADPRRDQWADVLTVACEELDRLFDDLTVGKRV